jgi:hypothetical protein
VAGVQGLTGLTPTVIPTVVTDPGASAEEIHGGTVNPAHASWEWDNPVPWAIQQGLDLSGQPVTVEGSLVGGTPSGAGKGDDPQAYADAALTHSHGAPWPWQHIPDSGAVNSAEVTAAQAQANQQLHSYDAGDVAAFTRQPVPHGQGKMPWNLSPDYTSSGAPSGNNVGDLATNNHTGLDRFAGDVVAGDNLNRFGMDGAHIQRQNPAGYLPVPLDTTMGVQRPQVNNVPGRYGSYPVGTGSPFRGQIPGVGNDTGAAEIGVASDYVPPPDAPTNPPLQPAASAPVWGVTGLGF